MKSLWSVTEVPWNPPSNQTDIPKWQSQNTLPGTKNHWSHCVRDIFMDARQNEQLKCDKNNWTFEIQDSLYASTQSTYNDDSQQSYQ